MNENTVIITERDGKYEVQNNGMPEFALLEILECIVFDMNGAGRQHSHTEPKKQDAVRGNRPSKNRKPTPNQNKSSRKPKGKLHRRQMVPTFAHESVMP